MAHLEALRVLAPLASWQAVGGPFQLHPGDVGWQWRFGAQATADALYSWDARGTIGAVGFLDGPTLRLAVDPELARDSALAAAVIAELPGDATSVEAPSGSLIREILAADGWGPGEQWQPLERHLGSGVADSGLDIRVVDSANAADRVAVQRAAFEGSIFTVERWRAMAEGPAYGDARCLVAHDAAGAAVATVTVWSAGEGRPGLIEPLGVHADHRGHGYGKAMTLAAASALRDLGAGSALVCTPKANEAAVATYVSAGFVPRHPIADLSRP